MRGNMDSHKSNIDELLKTRAELDEALRQHKAAAAVLFTDVVGSTGYFDRYGDTAGLSLLHRHIELARRVVQKFQGRVVKTIGDSVLADFSDSLRAVRAAREIQRRQRRLNQRLAERERFYVRVGIHSGVLFRSGNDVVGDVVNLAARITKRTGPAQVLLSKTIYQEIGARLDLPCRWIGKVTVEGKSDREDIYELIWAEPATYSEIRQEATGALILAHGETPPTNFEEALNLNDPPLRDLTDRYDILAEMGRGGMGIVYKAHERETGDIVALKILKPEIAANSTVTEQFKNEIRLARRITHKNVCRLHEFGRVHDTVYISMEFVDGESLRQVLIRFRSLSFRSGIHLALQICAGLREAHAQGIVHRDLKPENVMIDRAGNVKLMDFGIAHWAQVANGNTGSFVGTPSYMSPEQVKGAPPDSRADIYALGLILYEIFTGSTAFRGETLIDTALKHIGKRPVRPRWHEPNLPSSLEKIILRCLGKNPDKRFQSVEDLEAALGQVISLPSPENTPRSGFTQLFQVPSRNRLLGECVVLTGLSLLLIFSSRSLLPQPSGATVSATLNDSVPEKEVQSSLQTGARQEAINEVIQIESSKEQPSSPVRVISDLRPGIYWRLGSFEKEAEAETMAREVQDLGYLVFVKRRRSLWTFWRLSYEVLVGPYTDSDRSEIARRSLTNSGFNNLDLIRED